MKKYFIGLGTFWHFIYLFGPPKPCFCKEKAPSNFRKSKFCGILRTAKNPPLHYNPLQRKNPKGPKYGKAGYGYLHLREFLGLFWSTEPPKLYVQMNKTIDDKKYLTEFLVFPSWGACLGIAKGSIRRNSAIDGKYSNPWD